MQRGLLHIYCGDGKGKTTAATGLAIRAAGSGKKVLFARFLKDENSGELKILRQISEIEVLPVEKSFGFFWTLSETEKAEAKDMYFRLWRILKEKAESGAYDMLVMDECMAALRYRLLPPEEVVTFLKERPEELEVVLTGRDPDEELLALADYVSEIRKVKHPFDRGIHARKGIEY